MLWGYRYVCWCVYSIDVIMLFIFIVGIGLVVWWLGWTVLLRVLTLLVGVVLVDWVVAAGGLCIYFYILLVMIVNVWLLVGGC